MEGPGRRKPWSIRLISARGKADGKAGRRELPEQLGQAALNAVPRNGMAVNVCKLAMGEIFSTISSIEELMFIESASMY